MATCEQIIWIVNHPNYEAAILFYLYFITDQRLYFSNDCQNVELFNPYFNIKRNA